MKPRTPTLAADFRTIILAAHMMANRLEPAQAQAICRAAELVKAVARAMSRVFPTTKH